MTDYEDTKCKIDRQLADYSVLLYMKGTPSLPECGFSARAVKVLEGCGVSFHYVNILVDNDIRQTLPIVSNWPTFPQLYVKAELIGGSDIIMRLYQTGKLQQLFKEKLN